MGRPSASRSCGSCASAEHNLEHDLELEHDLASGSCASAERAYACPPPPPLWCRGRSCRCHQRRARYGARAWAVHFSCVLLEGSGGQVPDMRMAGADTDARSPHQTRVLAPAISAPHRATAGGVKRATDVLHGESEERRRGDAAMDSILLSSRILITLAEGAAFHRPPDA